MPASARALKCRHGGALDQRVTHARDRCGVALQDMHGGGLRPPERRVGERMVRASALAALRSVTGAASDRCGAVADLGRQAAAVLDHYARPTHAFGRRQAAPCHVLKSDAGRIARVLTALIERAAMRQL